MDEFKPLDLFGDGVATKTNNVLSNDDGTSSQDVSSEQPIQVESTIADQSTNNIDKEEKSEEVKDENIQNEEINSLNTDSESEDESVTADKKTNELEAFCSQVLTQLSELHQLFDKRIMHAEYEDKIIDQMHAELQKYKDDMYSQLIRPILLDIIEVRDSILRIAASYQKKSEGEQDIPNKTFADYSYDLQDILEKYNVEIYRSSQGDNFTPIRQRVIKKEITHDETLHGKIAASLSSGYSYLGRVISAEKVSIFYYEKVEETINESEENDNG